MTTATRRLLAFLGPTLVGAALDLDAAHQDGFDRLLLGMGIGAGVGLALTAFVRHDR